MGKQEAHKVQDIMGKTIVVGSKVVVDSFRGIERGVVAALSLNTVQIDIIKSETTEKVRIVEKASARKHIYVIK